MRLARRKIPDRTEQRDRTGQGSSRSDPMRKRADLDQTVGSVRSDRRVQKKNQLNPNEQKFKGYWTQKAKGFLKAELRRQNITYGELARRLKDMGWSETEGSVTVKINRGTFPVWFFMASLDAIGIDLHGYERRQPRSTSGSV